MTVYTNNTVAAAMFYWLARNSAPGWWKHNRATTKAEFAARFPELMNTTKTKR